VLALLAPLEPRVNGVADDGEQPGARVASAKTAEEFESAQTGFLHHVAGIVLVAGKPAREVIGRIEMRQNRFLKVRGFVFHRAWVDPVQNSPDQERRDFIPGVEIYFRRGINARVVRSGTSNQFIYA
jgi:hypothetical protein